MQKTIYLFTENIGYTEYRYNHLYELSEELKKRNIKIGDSATIGNSATIGYSATIGNYANIGNFANIGNSEIVKSIVISGSKHTVSYWGENRIDIGCHYLSIENWLSSYESIGIKNGYTKKEIEEYKSYIDLIKNIHDKKLLANETIN